MIILHFVEDDWTVYTARGGGGLGAGSKKEVIVVTGSTSGIGFELSKRLSKDGFVVFGTYRSEKDVPMMLEAGIQPLQMEITNLSSIQAAERVVRMFLKENKDTARFLGVVSNAGVLNAGPFEKVEVDPLAYTLDVHLKGTVLLSKVFMDLIKSDKGGRIVVMGSLAALLLPPANAVCKLGSFRP